MTTNSVYYSIREGISDREQKMWRDTRILFFVIKMPSHPSMILNVPVSPFMRDITGVYCSVIYCFSHSFSKSWDPSCLFICEWYCRIFHKRLLLRVQFFVSLSIEPHEEVSLPAIKVCVDSVCPSSSLIGMTIISIRHCYFVESHCPFSTTVPEIWCPATNVSPQIY